MLEVCNARPPVPRLVGEHAPRPGSNSAHDSRSRDWWGAPGRSQGPSKPRLKYPCRAREDRRGGRAPCRWAGPVSARLPHRQSAGVDRALPGLTAWSPQAAQLVDEVEFQPVTGRKRGSSQFETAPLVPAHERGGVADGIPFGISRMRRSGPAHQGPAGSRSLGLGGASAGDH